MKKLFTSDKFFKLAAFITLIAAVVADILTVALGYLKNEQFIQSYFVYAILVGIGAVVVYLSYKNHDKNTTKGMIGFLFALLLMVDVNTLFNIGTPLMSLFDSICAIFLVILDVLLIINHFVLGSDHGSRPNTVLFNQVLWIALVVMNIVGIVSIAVLHSGYFNDSLHGLNSVIYLFVYLFAFATIICVESRTDEYKAIRQEKGKN